MCAVPASNPQNILKYIHEPQIIITMDAASYFRTEHHSTSDETKSFTSMEVLPLRPGVGSSRSVVTPASPMQHSQRAFGRPDVWVGPPSGGRKKPTRSWRPKQSSDVTSQECMGKGADDARILDGSIHSVPTAVFKSNGNDCLYSPSATPEASLSTSRIGTAYGFGEPEESTIRIVEISAKAKHQLLDSSIHSTLTEDSKSRFSDAMETWRSAASIDVKHQGVPKGINIDSSTEFLSPMQRMCKKSDAWVAATKPRRTMQEEDVAIDDPIINHVTSLSSRPQNHGTRGKIQMWQSMSSLNSSPELTLPEKLKDDGNEPVPSLDESVTSISQHFDDSHHSFKTCLTSLTTSAFDGGEHSHKQGSGSSLLRRTEILPLKPGSPCKQGINESGIEGSSPLSPSSTHAHRGHSRPDSWVGPRGKPAKRSWKVKSIVEANEILSDDDDAK